jgi:hypothetical protein
MLTMRKTLALLAALAALSCVGCGSIAKDYVAADRQTLEAVAPEYRRYIEADAALDKDAKALRLATLDSWEYRVTQAEKAGGK